MSDWAVSKDPELASLELQRASVYIAPGELRLMTLASILSWVCVGLFATHALVAVVAVLWASILTAMTFKVKEKQTKREQLDRQIMLHEYRRCLEDFGRLSGSLGR